MRQLRPSILLGSGLADSAFGSLRQTQEESRRADQMIYGCRCETCRRMSKRSWLALEAAPAPGSVEHSKAPRRLGLALALALVPVPSAGVHRAKGRQSSLADQIEVHLHGILRKEQRLKGRSTPV